MKLIIDIPESLYDAINQDIYINGMRSGKTLLQKIVASIANGTPINNATNGDVIKAIFPQWKLMENTFEGMVLFDIPMKDGYLEHNACSREWWNTPYQKGGKE